MPASNGKIATNRRALLLSLAMLPFAFRKGYSQSLSKGVIRFGLTPVFLSDDLQLLAVIKTYLETATGYTIELTTRRTYQEVTALLVSGQLDAAWICGYPFIKYRDDLELVAVPEWNGKPFYQSYIITRTDRKIAGFSELEGDIHAYSDPDSNSGYLVTNALLHERNQSSDKFFKSTIFTYSHRNVIRAVASGLVQSGSVDGYVWEVMREIDPDLCAMTKIVRKSEWFGFPPIATNKHLVGSQPILALQQALFSAKQSKDGRAMLDYLRLSGFQKSSPSIFDGVAEKVNALRGVL